MEIDKICSAIEAVLFASGEPVAISRLAEVFDTDHDTMVGLCARLEDRIVASGSALEIVRIEDKLQLCTKKEYAQYIRTALDMRRNAPLSQAAMEVLAIIAYNEPVTKNLVERVRGVDCSGVISSLMAKGLIEEKGRLDLPGRPMLYKTSELFLRCFGLTSLKQLPKLPDDSDDQIDGQLSVEDVVDAADLSMN